MTDLRLGKKVVNRGKEALAAREGPARKDQDAAPIGDAIRAYWERDEISFAIPAHAAARSVVPDAAEWAGLAAFRADAPIGHGVDTRNRAWRVQHTAQELFAEAVGAEQTFFSTNGSSMSVHAAIATVAEPGETIVMGRNGHKSAFVGLVMSGADPVYVEPVYDQAMRLAHVVRAGDLAGTLEKHPPARAALVCTPNYYGASADVTALAECCHGHDIPLVTDGAWGLDYAFSDDLPPSPISEGADVAIGSVHKSLTGFSQTSVLAVQGDLIDRDRLQLCFELEESTSSSALLLSSIDAARRQFVRDGDILVERALEVAEHVREGVRGIDGIELVEVDHLLGAPGVAHADPTHVLIDVSPLGITGYQAGDFIRDEHQIDVELVDHRRLMALVSFGHDEDMADRLLAALHDLAEKSEGGLANETPDFPVPAALRTEQAMRPRDAFFAATRNIHVRDGAGEICAEIITPYPPGIPVLAPGEVITEPIIEYLREFVAIGGFLEGASDQTLEQIRVVARH